MGRRVLVVHPGASWAVHDVYVGAVEALRAAGVAVAEFRLDNRIERANGFLHYLWRKHRKANPGQKWPKPTAGDVLYRASEGMVERALEKGCTDILIVSALYVMPDRIVLARRAGLKVWLLCTETPYHLADELRLAGMVDGVWTHERAALAAFTAANPNTAYLPHAWREGVHNAPVAAQTGGPDVVFVGSMFAERLKWFESVDWSGIDLAIYGTPEMVPAKSPIRPFLRGGLVDNAALVGMAQRAKVALNFFRSTPNGEPAESLNPRCYEMAAARVCMVTDWRDEVAEKFGEHMPTFRTPDEAGALIRALLADPARRAACAAGAAAAVASDSWTVRAAQMLANIEAWRGPRKE